MKVGGPSKLVPSLLLPLPVFSSLASSIVIAIAAVLPFVDVLFLLWVVVVLSIP